MTAHAVSPAPPNINPEYEEDSDEDLAARETEAFLANLAYTVQNENADGYLSPDDGPVHITANTAFGLQCPIASAYLPPDDGSFQTAFELDEFLSNLEFYSSDEQHTGYLSSDTEPVQITAHMMSGDDLLILPTDKTDLPSPDDKDLPRDRHSPNFFHALLRRTKDQKQAVEIPLSYAHVFEADLVTAADINQHEARIYRPGFTPDELRDSIRLMLRTTKRYEEMVAFQAQNISPEHLDPHTHMVLHALLESRDRDKTTISRAQQSRIDTLDPDCPLDQEYAKLLRVHAKQDADYAKQGTERSDTNRTMYRVFSDGLYTVHQNNFALYCKPHLQNLPPNTAVELQNARKKLQDDELPPYRPIQFDTLPEPTVPTFETTLEKANVPPPTLLPRAQWMKDTPPRFSAIRTLTQHTMPPALGLLELATPARS